MEKTYDLNVAEVRRSITPNENRQAWPQSGRSVKTVLESRKSLESIILGDGRIVVPTGPCSTSSPEEVFEYAERLLPLSKKVESTMLVLMRVYFEKTRTNGGWKGLMTDPGMNNGHDFNTGVQLARFTLNRITDMGVPVVIEFLDPIAAKHVADFVTLGMSGARSSSSSTQHDMISGLSMPLGVKHNTDGDIASAINAMLAAPEQRALLSIDNDGYNATIVTKGNLKTILTLRGGKRPNFDTVSVNLALDMLKEKGFPARLIVDCSHGNSYKDHKLQWVAWKDLIWQIVRGNRSIVGLGLESNLVAGRQEYLGKYGEYEWGKSFTDACIGWEENEELLLWAHEKLSKIR